MISLHADHVIAPAGGLPRPPRPRGGARASRTGASSPSARSPPRPETGYGYIRVGAAAPPVDARGGAGLRRRRLRREARRARRRATTSPTAATSGTPASSSGASPTSWTSSSGTPRSSPSSSPIAPRGRRGGVLPPRPDPLHRRGAAGALATGWAWCPRDFHWDDIGAWDALFRTPPLDDAGQRASWARRFAVDAPGLRALCRGRSDRCVRRGGSGGGAHRRRDLRHPARPRGGAEEPPGPAPGAAADPRLSPTLPAWRLLSLILFDDRVAPAVGALRAHPPRRRAPLRHPHAPRARGAACRRGAAPRYLTAAAPASDSRSRGRRRCCREGDAPTEGDRLFCSPARVPDVEAARRAATSACAAAGPVAVRRGRRSGWFAPAGEPPPPPEVFLDRPRRATPGRRACSSDGRARRQRLGADGAQRRAGRRRTSAPASPPRAPPDLPAGVHHRGDHPVILARRRARVEPGCALDTTDGPDLARRGRRGAGLHPPLRPRLRRARLASCSAGSVERVSVGPVCKVRGELAEQRLRRLLQQAARRPHGPRATWAAGSTWAPAPPTAT